MGGFATLTDVWYKLTGKINPNSITLAGSELAPNRFGAGSELVRSWFHLDSIMEFGFKSYTASTAVKINVLKQRPHINLLNEHFSLSKHFLQTLLIQGR